METFWYIMIFVLGAIIGSFLNVVIYRLHTGRSLDGRSHCMSCGTVLTWYELFPIVSYLLLRARCRSCGAFIPTRYFTVELFTGATFAFLFSLFSTDYILFALHAVLLSVLIVIAVYDMRHTVIPDELTITTGGIALMLVILEVVRVGDMRVFVSHLIGGAGAALFFFFLWYISKGKWLGFGDVKLALPLGFMVGAVPAFSMVVLSFWIGAAISLTLLGLQKLFKTGKTPLRFLRYPLTIKSEVPFAPFLILGFLVVHLFHADIFTITLFFMGGS